MVGMIKFNVTIIDLITRSHSTVLSMKSSLTSIQRMTPYIITVITKTPENVKYTYNFIFKIPY